MTGLNQQEQGGAVEKLKELSVEYLEWRLSLNTSAATLRSQGRNLTNFIQWLDQKMQVRPAAELQGEHLRAWQVFLPSRLTRLGRPLMARSINNYIVAIAGFLHYLVDQGMIQKSVPDSLYYVCAALN